MLLKFWGNNHQIAGNLTPKLYFKWFILEMRDCAVCADVLRQILQIKHAVELPLTGIFQLGIPYQIILFKLKYMPTSNSQKMSNRLRVSDEQSKDLIYHEVMFKSPLQWVQLRECTRCFRGSLFLGFEVPCFCIILMVAKEYKVHLFQGFHVPRNVTLIVEVQCSQGLMFLRNHSWWILKIDPMETLKSPSIASIEPGKHWNSGTSNPRNIETQEHQIPGTLNSKNSDPQEYQILETLNLRNKECREHQTWGTLHFGNIAQYIYQINLNKRN